MYWCQGGELNSRPRAYESPALPLSYPGKRVSGFFVVSIENVEMNRFWKRQEAIVNELAGLRNTKNHPLTKFCTRRGSNPQPTASETVTLSN